MTMQVVTADQCNRSDLDKFLSRVYPPAKSYFLSHHASWWHGGDYNRVVLLLDGSIVGYVAFIPVKLSINCELVEAIYCVDLVIAPEHRGKGLQSQLDKAMKSRQELKVGFPNALNAKIRLKYAWGVRDDLSIMLNPIKYRYLNPIRFAAGLRGVILKVIAFLLSPLALFQFLALKAYQPKRTFKAPGIDPVILSAIYINNRSDAFSTTHRDSTHFIHRYLNAPNKDEFVCFISEMDHQPTHYLVARVFSYKGVLIGRILDIFGNFEDKDTLRDLVRTCLKDMVARGVSQVTVMVSLPGQESVFRKEGFLFKSPTNFCWVSNDQQHMVALQNKVYWTLADSDNDEMVD